MCCTFDGAARRCKHTVRLALEQSLKWFQFDSVSHVFTTDSIFHRILRCLSKRVFFHPLSVCTPLGMKPWSCTHAIQTLPLPLTCSLLKLAFSGVNNMTQWIKIALQRPEKLGLISRSHGGEKAWTPRSHLWLMYSHTYAHGNKTEFLNLGLCNLLLPYLVFCQMIRDLFGGSDTKMIMLRAKYIQDTYTNIVYVA